MSDKVASHESATAGNEQAHPFFLRDAAQPRNGEARIWWECERCTACCRWPGFVRVAEEELGPIAAHLGMEEAGFIEKYTRLRPDRQGLALIDKPNGECFFLNGNECALQPVKPGQCRGFPNRWNFPGWREICQAKPVLMPSNAPSS